MIFQTIPDAGDVCRIRLRERFSIQCKLIRWEKIHTDISFNI